jgi:glycerophosphoryl diester phosphodiesterase
VIARARGSGLHRAVVSSFEPSVVAEVRARQPGWACWLNAIELNGRTVASARALGCAGVAAHWSSVNRRTVADATSAALAVATWTVRRRPTRQRLERLPLATLIVEGPAIPDGNAGLPGGVVLS